MDTHTHTQDTSYTLQERLKLTSDSFDLFSTVAPAAASSLFLLRLSKSVRERERCISYPLTSSQRLLTF